MSVVFETEDTTGRRIYLTQERYPHICKHPETLRRWNDFYLSDKKIVPLESYRTGLSFIDEEWIMYDG